LLVPDRIIKFRVDWRDDAGELQLNQAWRVQFNNVLGVYKGGLRFSPAVSESVLKFLGFEQTFKNALTALPMGGGKGGSDFNPRGRSEAEVRRFCEALMLELNRHIGPLTDVPAGDIGVGGREIGWLHGAYRRLRNDSSSGLTGKGPAWGGSLLRTEATGYGAVYFAQQMLSRQEKNIDGLKVVVSGSGNVALHCAEKAIELGGCVLTLSDSDGSIHDADGLTLEKLNWIKELKLERRGRIKEFADEFGVEYMDGSAPWSVSCDIAFPCTTQNELDADAAATLIDNGCFMVVEGANMPLTSDAHALFRDARVPVAPGKAANAGGVAVSGLELSQNAQRLSWTRETVDERLHALMADIHRACVEYGELDGWVDYPRGADIAGFVRVAQAMIDQGEV
jgi:glutamate dehydrogenase (NADP+)